MKSIDGESQRRTSEVSHKRKSEKRRKKKIKEEKDRESQKKEDAGVRKGRKAARHRVFPFICGSGGSKIGRAKASGAEPSGHTRDAKLHAVVARSKFRSHNVQNTSVPECVFEVEMSKEWKSFWRQPHVEVKSTKN